MNHSPNSLWLVGARLAVDPHTAVKANLEIADGNIRSVNNTPPPSAPIVNLDNHLILPGLINAHDHLEFNLFPRLGRGPYPNSVDWARDIYRPHLSPIREHLLVPKPVRLWWGGLKNLLSGVTTVCHHNPYDRTFEQGFPLQVVRRYGWAHSMAFEQDVFRAFASTEPEAPFIIHAGEGTDERSQDEVFELDRIGVLTCRTIIVHGVAFSKAGHALREQRGAALVWCPTSNRFLLGTTLDITSLNSIANIAVGSDSALTAQGNLLDEIRAARNEGTSPESIYEMVTETAASILRLNNGEGRLEAGSVANLVAIPWTRRTPAEAILDIDISDVRMVMVSGVLNLASDDVIPRFPASSSVELEKLNVDGVKRWVRAPIRWLIQKTTEHVGDICLAGRSVSL